jgi:hypothetical protein
MDDARRTSSVPSLSERLHDRFDRTLHVALDEEREFLAPAGLELAHHLRASERAAPAPRLLALWRSRYSVISRARASFRPPRSGRRLPARR